MFSGIIRAIGKVESISFDKTKHVLFVQSQIFSDTRDPIKIGDSIAISGTCLTVVSVKDSTASFDIASETCRKTNLGELQAGDLVNLERSLKFGERIDGHLVQGHVDTTTCLTAKTEELGNTVRLSFSLPTELAGLIAEKGSITIDGISLTVGEVTNDEFSVYIVPHTLNETTLKLLKPGGKVNLEVDCLARYVQGVLSAQGIL